MVVKYFFGDPRAHLLFYFKFIEIVMALVILLFATYGGAIGLGADPHVRDNEMDLIGPIPWGTNYSEMAYGHIVTGGFLLILLVVTVGLFLGETPFVMLFQFNFLGFIMYIVLGAITYSSWTKSESAIVRYRNLTGVAPSWRKPYPPLVLALMCIFIAIVFLVDSMIVVLYGLGNTGRKKVRFNSEARQASAPPTIRSKLKVPDGTDMKDLSKSSFTE